MLFGQFDQKQKCSFFTFVQYIIAKDTFRYKQDS